MRRTNGVVLLVAAMLLAALMQACGPAVPGTTATQPPVTTGDEVPASATLPPAVASAVQKRLDSDYTLSHWTAAEGGYYLIETTFVPTGEHAYE